MLSKVKKVLIILTVTGLIWQFSFGKVQTASAAEKTGGTEEEILDVKDDAGIDEDEDSEANLPVIEDVVPEPSLPEVKGVQPQNSERPKNSVDPQPQEIPSSLPIIINPGDVIINELMWMGSSVSTADEWIEFKNRTDNDIPLDGWQITKISAGTEQLMLTIPAGESILSHSRFLIANGNSYAGGDSQLDIEPDIWNTAVDLSDTNLQIKIYQGDYSDPTNLIDTAGGGGNPLAGINTSTEKYSMERNSTHGDGTLVANWHTANKAVNFDAASTIEKGTPKAINSQTPNFILVMSNKAIYKNGNTVIITATLNQNNYQVTADFSLLDDQYASGYETVVNNNNTYTITYTISNSNNLTDANNVVIQVTADDEINSPPVTNSSLMVDLDNTPPGVPQKLRVTTGEGFVYLSWDAVLDLDFDHFNIYKSGSDYSRIGETTLTEYQDVDVIGGKTYYYQITAVDKAGNESSVAKISATPPIIIIAPEVIIRRPQVVQPQIAAAVVEKEPVKEIEEAPEEEPGEVKGEEAEEEEVPTNWPLIIGIALAVLVVVFWVYYWYVSWKESKTKTRKRK